MKKEELQKLIRETASDLRNESNFGPEYIRNIELENSEYGQNIKKSYLQGVNFLESRLLEKLK